MFLFHDREDPPGWVPVQWLKPKILTDFHTSDYVCLRAFVISSLRQTKQALGLDPVCGLIVNAAILIERNVADRSGTCSYVPTEGDVVFWRYPWGTSARY